jgi:hypothetical protein
VRGFGVHVKSLQWAFGVVTGSHKAQYMYVSINRCVTSVLLSRYLPHAARDKRCAKR